MTQYLPPNLLALFAPREPVPFLPPPDKLPHQKKTTGYSGVSAFLNEFEDPAVTPPPLRIETREERQERKRREKAESVAYRLECDIAKWNPHGNPDATSDPYKTLFVARINYDTSESKVRREFEMYGEIKNIGMVFNKNSGEPRGYAFIEYERERDMHTAYKRADGRKIDGRRVLVDVERGRTVKGWLPRRLGGGLGGTRRGGPEVNLKHSGREEPRGDDRYGPSISDHERERPERPERPERRRSRSRSRDRRRRSRSRDRHRSDRHKRDRSKERDRGGRDREPMLGGPDKIESADIKVEMPPEGERKERRRSRSRDRDRERRRRRSRSRERSKWHDREREGRRHERGGGGDNDDRMREDRMREADNPAMDTANPQNGFNDQGY